MPSPSRRHLIAPSVFQFQSLWTRHKKVGFPCLAEKSPLGANPGILHIYAESAKGNEKQRLLDNLVTLPFPVLWSNQTRAWFLDSTLQSKVALFCAGRQRATERPILMGLSSRHDAPETGVSSGGKWRWPRLTASRTDLGVSPTRDKEEFQLIRSHHKP